MKFEEKYTTKTADETELLGRNLAKELQPQDVVYLYGDLGSGKTTFTKGIAKGLGVTARIISPTFVVARTHKTADHKIKTLYHLDLYRLKNSTEVLGVNINDYLDDTFGVVVIEWPELSTKLINKKSINVRFAIKDKGREITIERNSS